MNIRSVKTKEDIDKCEGVILELRPHLKDKNIWHAYQLQQKENFELLFIEVDGIAVAFIGYRTQHLFFSGKTIYIDDLCSLPEHREKGYGGKLLDHVFKIAKEQNCDTVSLDSGHFRYGAHKLYLNKGFKIMAHHFNYSLR